jgi:hypothetical protein
MIKCNTTWEDTQWQIQKIVNGGGEIIETLLLPSIILNFYIPTEDKPYQCCSGTKPHTAASQCHIFLFTLKELIFEVQ